MKSLNYNHTVVNADGTHAELCNVSGGGHSGGGLKLTPIWTNPNPDSAMGAETLNIGDTSGFQFIMIKYLHFKTATPEHQGQMSTLIPIDSLLGDSKPITHLLRGATDTRIIRQIQSAGDSTKIKTLEAHNGSSTANDHLIPYIIYGIK